MSNGQFIKVVIVGPSGVGKTSLRHQYISGRFTTGYRATIGTDFITKTIPHYSQPRDAPVFPRSRTASEDSVAIDDTASSAAHPPSAPSVTLQIWDTAGQERFSSLSAAFFRGADAVILVFDVNKPETLQDLIKWWDEFRIKVPIQEGRETEYCTVVVGNKTDLVSSSQKAGKDIVDWTAADTFLQGMIPPKANLDKVVDSPTSSSAEPPRGAVVPGSEPATPATSQPVHQPMQSAADPGSAVDLSESSTGVDEVSTPRPSQLLRFRSLEQPKFGTLNTIRTEVSIYHTPSSSLFYPSSSRSHSRDSTGSPSDLAARNVGRIRGKQAGGGLERIPSTGHTEEDFTLDVDPTFDDSTFGGGTSIAGTSAGYVTAKSDLTLSQGGLSSDASSNPIPMLGRLGGRRPPVPSILSDSSLTTVRPIAAGSSRNTFLFADPSVPLSYARSHSNGLPLSPPRSRASTRSSSNSTVSEHTDHEDKSSPLDYEHDNKAVTTTGLPTPSASPPSPPRLTASLIATMREAQAQEMQAANLAGPKQLDLGPILFFTSAKTGGTSSKGVEGANIPIVSVPEIFDYLAERVVRRREWEEEVGPELESPAGDRDDSQPRPKGFTIRLHELFVGRHRVRDGCCS